MNFYNEIDDYCCDWLGQLIQSQLIPPGVVDRRDIRDIAPAELAQYVQCHFFAGIAGWPLALARAGVRADRPLWTGSCPCQPFSAAGKRGGFSDERHLWPVWFKLIKACRPQLIFGEQVASAKDWLYKVKFDLEHVSMSDGGREALYGVQTDKTLEKLSYLSWAWLLRAAALVQNLPKEVRSEVAVTLKRTAQSVEGEEAREGQDIPTLLDCQKQGIIFDRGMSETVRAEKYPFRFTSLDDGDRLQNQKRHLRSDRLSASFRSGQRTATEQCVSGQDRFDTRLFIQEYSSCVFGDQLSSEQLERRGSVADHQSVGEEINDQQSFANAARKESSFAPEGERFVRGDLEALDYAVGFMPVEAASAGADHLRDRFWFVADDGSGRCNGSGRRQGEQPWRVKVIGASNFSVAQGDADEPGSQGWGLHSERAGERASRPAGVADSDFFFFFQSNGGLQRSGQFGGAGGDQEARASDMADRASSRRGDAKDPRAIGRSESSGSSKTRATDGVLEPQRDGDPYEWVIGADGKARRVESGIRLLAHGVPNRIPKLRAFGNAIDPRPAEAFIRAALNL